MAKKTTKTPAKKAKKKPVTMAERVKRIELDVNRHGAAMHSALSSMDEFLREATDKRVLAIDRRTMEQGKVLDSICRSLALDMGDRLKAHTDMLNRIERLLAKPQDVTGSPVTIPEQGLEVGDYTDASKEVADALTAMGYQWLDKDRFMLAFIRLAYCPDSLYHGRVMFNRNGTPETGKYYPQAEFISRASVTAKALGLVAKEEEPWKPEVGQHVKPSARANDGWVLDPLRDGVISGIMQGTLIVEEANGVVRKGIFDWRYEPMSPEEVAKYHADIEAAKPIVPYVTRVMREGNEFMVIGIDDGKYVLHHHGAAVYQVPREAFKVIDP